MSRKINFKKQANKLLRKAKRVALKPNGAQEQLKRNASKMSKKMTAPEKTMKKMLKEIGVEFEAQKIIGNKIFDFYIPCINLLIEVDGDYWHANQEKYDEEDLNSIQKRNIRVDEYKNTLASGRGYELLRVWESELKNDYERIKKMISNKINL
jgi:very-short-patch-repair endonuclease